LITIIGGNTALVWNTYTLFPHAMGPVEVTASDISQYLTDKGREIMKRLAAAAPQAETPTADDDGPDWAAWNAMQDAIEAEQFWWDDDPEIIEAGTFMGNPLTSITIGANVTFNEGPGEVQDAFPGTFDVDYNNNGKQAGTYTLNNGVWTKQF